MLFSHQFNFLKSMSLKKSHQDIQKHYLLRELQIDIRSYFNVRMMAFLFVWIVACLLKRESKQDKYFL